MRRLLLTACLGFGLVSNAHGQVTIHLESTECLLNGRPLPAFQYVPLQVFAVHSTGTPVEILEFRITGFSSENLVFVANLTPNPEATITGNPFEEGGIVTFSSCQESPEPILLFSCELFSLVSGYEPQVEVQQLEVPTNPVFSCGTAISCDASVSCLSSYVSSHQILEPPSNPFPPHGATNVALDVQLSVSFGDVCDCLGLPCTFLDFGVDPDPPSFDGGCDIPLPQPAPLAPNTTYYWRVQEDYCGTTISPVWSFTTVGPVATNSISWGRVKALFR